MLVNFDKMSSFVEVINQEILQLKPQNNQSGICETD